MIHSPNFYGFPPKIMSLLKKHYPEAKIVLNFNNNWELLVAVVLSAQCTDKMVNKVTSTLFKKYSVLDDYIKADFNEFAADIKPTGFYRQKAKNILSTANMIKTEYKGHVPDTMSDLLKLPGVARKTANIILGNAFAKSEGIAVDTHVRRLSQRLGLTKNSNPVKIEIDLMKLFDRREWFQLTYLFIEHGRRICNAKKPKCDQCFLNQLCPCAFRFPHFVT
ncbi:endonuclease III [Candidatus Gottesmanbacteria bacterium RIFCSPLOWO2_01_FULL_40_10]|uniref:Endonuclease III n=1 Tax=Candidatus Gottesmanbacteria bacterium RIFCSPHIGHO2_01_FULL_40_15 TaxID=1798376 RepID=A0A1F5Z381_9BACT|nr:MAG: endonuclease III [Candidatus Gottesmanbacteria bacterium RIFCSPHIGHO2_01_FULL_40_15]OGG21242.1 MAG: endonuclease III [Candidatus Gottesmanbacteria bacterium RIFCSPLOWO2_01_FULL_40_10]OGG23573.1 MAG: endonuclease III [Candidatus Gottesmanbacteria bacterium RIFCSPHIGHO2_12_FULL_40_13]OGG32212.1 MAG: endonuclease III [Candidatus Gottesmanbacteria bacterium RIFCSPLOWO2_02_FULL_40_10]